MGGRGPRWGLIAAIALLGVAVVSVAGAGSRAVPARGTIQISTTRAADLHDELWVLDLRTGRRTNFSRNQTADREPAVSPDGSLVAFVSDRGGAEAIWLRRSGGGGVRRLAGPFAERPGQFVQAGSLRWSPDGRLLAFLVQRRPGVTDVRVVPHGGGSARRVAQRALDAAWAPDSRRLAVSESDARGAKVVVHDLTGRVLWRLPGSLIGWSARGQLAVAEQGRVAVASSNGRIERRVSGLGGFWSADGRYLALAAGPRGIRLVDQVGRVRMLSTTLSLDGTLPVWAPDSRSLLARDRQFRLVEVTLAGRVTVRRPGGAPAAWGPGGALILSAGGGLRVERRGVGLLFAVPRGSGPCSSGVQAVTWLDRNRVVYQAGRHGQQAGDLWMVDRTGRTQQRFLGSDAWEGPLDWAPGGDVAVYEHGDTLTHGSGCDGPYTPHLRIVEPDGAVQVLTRPELGAAYDSTPRWSPDGRQVAFARGSISDSQQFGIFAVDVASGEERRLTRGVDHSPSWTEDGSAVIFQRGNGADIRRVGVSTGVVSPVTAGQAPEASPLGRLVAFVRDEALWTAGLDGSAVRRLAAIQPVAASPAFVRVTERPKWSPDGRRLALVERPGILVVDADGRNASRIAAAGARGVEWSPDGRTLAFAAPVGNYSRGIFSSGFVARTELYVVPSTGGRPTRLTNDYANVLSIAWRP